MATNSVIEVRCNKCKVLESVLKNWLSHTH